MNELATVLLGLTIVGWLGVVIFMSPAVWAIYVQQARWGDQARLVCFLYGLLMIGFVSRRWFTREPIDESMVVLLLASLAVAIGTIFVAFNYGRGGRV